MPSSLSLNGLNVYRPAIYAEVDASALGGRGLSTGNVCIVGAFPQFKQSEALSFSSAQDLVAYDPADPELALLGSIAFSPSLDDRIPAGAQTLSFLNVQPTTQASVMLLDADGGDALLVKSSLYGSRGNRTTIKAENENTDQIKLTVKRDASEEIFEGIESGDLASVYYAGSLLSVVTLLASRSSVALSWTQTSGAMSNGSLSVDVSDMSLNSTLDVTPSASDHTSALSFTISGLSSAGAVVSETLSFVAGDNAQQTTSSAFSSITSIAVTSDDTAYTGTFNIEGSLTLTPSEYASLPEMVDSINALSGFVASYDAARSYPADEIDAIPSSSIVGIGNKANIRADLYAVIEALSSSALVTVSRASGGTQRLAQSDGDASITARLEGGASTLTSLSDWTSALATIEASDFQILVGWTTNIDQMSEIKKHLPLSARAGKERNAWLASPANTSLSSIKSTYTQILNDRNIAFVGQSINVEKPNGTRETLSPLYLALMLAAMQAGSPIGTPLTRKRPRVNDVSGSWNGNTQAKEAILSGVVSLSFEAQGYRVERSVTTYMSDNNPIFSEVSANESVNASIRDLRSELDRFVGAANRSLTANRVKSLAQSRLNRQVQDGIIKSFRDVVVQDGGDTLIVGYTVSAVEPLNFIRLDVSVAR